MGSEYDSKEHVAGADGSTDHHTGDVGQLVRGARGKPWATLAER